MTVLSRAMKTTTWKPPRNAAEKMKNFEKNPAKGGIPASEKSASIITTASLGFVR